MQNRKNYSAAIALVVCTFFYIGCTLQSTKEVPEKEAKTVLKETEIPIVDFEILQPTEFFREIISNGTLAACRKADLKWDVSNVITRVLVKNGDRVQAGQLLAEADPESLQLTLQEAQNNKERAYLEMQDFLIGQGYKLADSASIPSKILKLAATKSGYRQAELSYKSAQIALRKASLRAPFSGVVANLTTKPFNKPGGDFFCTLLDNNNMEVIFPVMENEIKAVKKNDQVGISLVAEEENEVKGVITEINPVIANNGLVQVKAIIKQVPNGWFDGMKTNVKVRRSITEQLVVPKKAVVMRDNKLVVFTVKGARAYWNYVTTGEENSQSYTIISGLTSGDSVIIEGNLNLAHFSPILLKE